MDKTIDFLDYDRNIFDVRIMGFGAFFKKAFYEFSIDYRITKKDNHLYYDYLCLYKRDNIVSIDTHYKHFSIYDIPKEFIGNNNVIMIKNNVEEYLEYIDYLKSEMPRIDTKHSYGSDSDTISLEYNYPYRTSYCSLIDGVTIFNDDNKSIDSSHLEDLLNNKIVENEFSDYMLGLIEKSEKKDIILDENDLIARKKAMQYTITENDNSLVLKRSKLDGGFPLAKHIYIPIKHY